MKEFNLKFNLFENEIENLEDKLWVSRTGQSEYEGDDGFLHHSDSIKILEKQFEEMRTDRNKSKNIILDVLNNAENYPQNVKDFYLEWLSVCINDKNEFTYGGKSFDYHQIYEDMLVEYLNKNNFIYKEHNRKIIYDITKNNNFPALAKMIKEEQGIKSLQLSNGKYGEVIEKYIENNLSSCIKLGTQKNNENEQNNVINEKEKQEKKKQFLQARKESLKKFAKKIYKEALDKGILDYEKTFKNNMYVPQVINKFMNNMDQLKLTIVAKERGYADDRWIAKRLIDKSDKLSVKENERGVLIRVGTPYIVLEDGSKSYLDRKEFTNLKKENIEELKGKLKMDWKYDYMYNGSQINGIQDFKEQFNKFEPAVINNIIKNMDIEAMKKDEDCILDEISKAQKASFFEWKKLKEENNVSENTFSKTERNMFTDILENFKVLKSDVREKIEELSDVKFKEYAIDVWNNEKALNSPCYKELSKSFSLENNIFRFKEFDDVNDLSDNMQEIYDLEHNNEGKVDTENEKDEASEVRENWKEEKAKERETKVEEKTKNKANNRRE